MKVCRTCKADKDISQFSSSGQGDRLRGTCKECSRAKEKSQIEVRRASDGVIPEFRVCSQCQNTSPLTSEFFKPSKANKFGLKSECLSCTTARNKAWLKTEKGALMLSLHVEKYKPRMAEWAKKYQQKNRDKINQYVQSWREKNRDHCRKVDSAWARNNKDKITGYRHMRRAAGKFSYSVIIDLRKLQKGKCAICREMLKSSMEVDHIFPVSLGGTNERTNLQLLCRTCNRRKGARHPIDHMQRLGYLL